MKNLSDEFVKLFKEKEKIKYPLPKTITLKERLKRRKRKKQARKQSIEQKRRK